MENSFENFKKNHREDILKDTKLTSFFPLHTVPYHEKQNRCGTSYQPLFELQNIFRKIIFWSDPLNLETVERKGKNWQNIQYTKNKKSFLGVIKIIFRNF